MAPHSRITNLSPRESWPIPNSPGDLIKIFLCVSIIATAFKSYAVLSLRKKRSLDHRTMIKQEKDQNSPSQEKKHLIPHARNDSASAQTVDKVVPTKSSQPDESNQRLQAIQQELSSPTLKPIHPWIAPPTPLPGPYDAPYYPLPSIRRHSDVPSCDPPETHQTIPYTRRVSASNVPSEYPVLRGTITVSNHGWRRTQWTVATG
jgi:hypothetical protein